MTLVILKTDGEQGYNRIVFIHVLVGYNNQLFLKEQKALQDFHHMGRLRLMTITAKLCIHYQAKIFLATDNFRFTWPEHESYHIRQAMTLV